MARSKSPDQIPLSFMMPESSWTPPAELPDLRRCDEIAIDTETRDDGLRAGRGTGWAYKAGYIAGVSMAGGDRAVYVPLRHPDTKCHDRDAVRRWLKDHYDSPARKIFQNAPYDLGWIQAEFDLESPKDVDDTIAAAFTLDENRLTYNLDDLCTWQGVPGKDKELLEQALSAINGGKGDMWRLPGRYVGPYGEGDAVSTLGLFQAMRPKLQAQGLWDAYRLEADIIPMVVEMRRRGIRVDTEHADTTRLRLLQKRDDVLAEMGRLAGSGRSLTMKELNSPQVMTRLFSREQVPFPTTEKGNPSFKSDWMEKFDHWLPSMAALAMKIDDAGEKFIGSYIQDYTHLGRIHAEIHQYRDGSGGTRTTRFAYSDPPLQQMPSRDPEIGKAIRSLFLPEEGEVWGALDFSQQEYRLMVHFAHLSHQPGVEEAVRVYRENPDADFHQLVAGMTHLPRRRAKDVNFAKAYGAGIPKFSAMTGLSMEEATSVTKQYDEKMPFLKALSEHCQRRAQQRGYIKLLDGARSRFDRWEPSWVDWRKMAQHTVDVSWPDMPTFPCSYEEALARTRDTRHFWFGKRLQRSGTHKAMNRLIQGSAARQTKMVMRACWREGFVPLIQMHDELGTSFSQEAPARRMRELMVDTVELVVPVKVDAEFGYCWGTAKVDKDTGYGATFDEAMVALRSH